MLSDMQVVHSTGADDNWGRRRAKALLKRWAGRSPTRLSVERSTPFGGIAAACGNLPLYSGFTLPWTNPEVSVVLPWQLFG